MPQPSLDELGRDLLIVPRWQVAFSLAAPFALAAQGEWLAALACPVLLSFLTYGSISHAPVAGVGYQVSGVRGLLRGRNSPDTRHLIPVTSHLRPRRPSHFEILRCVHDEGVPT